MENKIDYKNIIKSVSDNQYEILYNILKLYNNGEDFDCDPTYSKGGYYNKGKEYNINQPKFRFDVYPIIDGVEKIEPLGSFPLEDDSIQSINIDLPFVCAPHDSPSTKREGKKHNIIQNRFVSYYPIVDLFESYHHFLSEAFRVLKPGGICVWKTQRTISGGKAYFSPEMSWMFANEIGFYCKDRLTLVAKNRLWSGKIKKQEHSRSFDSQFYVFQKPDGSSKQKPIDYYKWRNTTLQNNPKHKKNK